MDEFFVAPCPGTGVISIDDADQGENKRDSGLHVFQCGTGFHDISMACSGGKKCKEPVKRKVLIAGTNPLDPMKVPFECDG